MIGSEGQAFNRRDVVPVNFQSCEETGSKRRPVLAINSPEYHQGRQEAVVAAITSNTRRILPGDYLMDDWEHAGLPLPSVVTGIIRTVKRGMFVRRLGRVSDQDMAKIDAMLKHTLGLFE
jgi:mRNA interferase MazF